MKNHILLYSSHMEMASINEAELDRWVIAKRDRDFATADAIRSELRKQGVDADIERPANKDGILLNPEITSRAVGS